MNLFFHHVGQVGARQDFPKTVFEKHSISKLISDGILSDTELIKQLGDKFPDGEFNCWGVPAGASSVIRNLKEGDYVLLVESSRIDGIIPALCPVKIFWRYELRGLSEYLWGDSKFPFIFFFNTIQIELMWIQLIEDLGYKENFSPRGNFYKVGIERLINLGGVGPYINNILNRHSGYRGEDIHVTVVDEDPEDYNLFDLQTEEEKLGALVKAEPILIDNSVSQRLVKLPKRDQAFSMLIKKHYNFQCAVCSQNIKSPLGYPAVHAAHIFPKERYGSDDLRNGICLCFLHHWAFDAGWFNIDDNYKILIRNDIPRTEDYKNIFMWENFKIGLPKNKSVWPHSLFLTASRKLYGF